MGNLQGTQLQPMYLPNGGDPEDVNLTSLQQPGMLGGKVTVPTASQGSKEYQLVQVDSSPTNTPAGTVYDGAQALWADRNSYKVGTAVSVLGRGNVAGVFVNAPTPGNFTCIQIRGLHDSVKIIDAPTASPTAAGLFVTPSATNGKFDVLAAGTAATYPPVGRTQSTMNLGNNTCQVLLEVPEIP